MKRKLDELDLDNLTASANRGFSHPADIVRLVDELRLSSRAFDVMLRRHWWPCPVSGNTPPKWCVHTLDMLPFDDVDGIVAEEFQWPDPFTALVEADKWLTEREKGGVQ